MKSAYIRAFSSINCLGTDHKEILSALQRKRSGLMRGCRLTGKTDCTTGEIRMMLPKPEGALQPYASRCCRIALHCFQQLAPWIARIRENVPDHRIGVVIGTSASGTGQIEASWVNDGAFDFDYHHLHSFGSVSELLARAGGFTGPAYSVSTACSSGANALISGVNLIRSGMCDVVLTGGMEAMCQTTLNGFDSLQILDPNPCAPFDANRAGLNIGEGGALFLLAGDHVSLPEFPSSIRIAGAGWSSDGYHMTAPEPNGAGAAMAMGNALQAAGLAPNEIDYINMHGTGTPLNDLAESRAVARLFGSETPCSSTKSYTGHLLGAAAAAEIAISCLVLEHQFLPVNLNLTVQDPEITIKLVTASESSGSIRYAMSNSFAFGGNNTAVILGVDHA